MLIMIPFCDKIKTKRNDATISEPELILIGIVYVYSHKYY